MARGKGEGSIYKQSDGLWAASITLPDGPDGKRRRKVVRRKNKADVVTEMQKFQSQLSKNGDLPTGSMTTAKWLAYWMDEIAAPKVRPKTMAGNRSVVNGHIVPAIGKVRLEKLNANHVRILHNRILNTPKDKKLRDDPNPPPGTVMLSSTYALNAHNILSAALKAAHREGRILANPCEMVDAPRKRNADQLALTTEQAVRLLAYALPRPNGAMWATFLLTGARRGEVLGLEADRIGDTLDFSWQLLRITDISNAPNDYEYREVGKSLYLTRPKSKAGVRILPLIPPLKQILELHMQDRGSGLLFTKDGGPWDPDDATDAWKALLKDAGLPTDVVLHGSRHTVVDLLFASGAPEAVIQEIVGHSSRMVTRGYRTKGNIPQLTRALEGVAALLTPEK